MSDSIDIIPFTISSSFFFDLIDFPSGLLLLHSIVNASLIFSWKTSFAESAMIAATFFISSSEADFF